MFSPPHLRTLAAAVTVLFATSAVAHDTWLAPDRYHRASPSTVRLFLTSGMAFPKLDHPIQPDRVAIGKGRDASGRTVALVPERETADALVLSCAIALGVTTFSVVLHPRPSQLKPGQVRDYVAHLGLADPETVIGAWKKRGETAVQYRYVKYAKTFVRAGDADGGRTWGDPAGMRLEFVPENDPTLVSPRDTMRVVLLDGRKPRTRYPISVVHGGTLREYRTDDQGRATIEIPASGPYLVRATTLVVSNMPDTDWDVHFTTLSFEVR